MTADTGSLPAPNAALRRVRAFGRRHRRLVAVLLSLAVAAALAAVLAGRREEFAQALTSVPLWLLVLAAALQVVALVARTEAWHGCIGAAGGRVARRVLFRASGIGYVASVFNSNAGVAARIAALRRSCPQGCPRLPTLIAAELPILAVEAMLAALTSFTLVEPLGLPWWLPIALFLAMAVLSTGLRRLSRRTGRELWRGLAALGTAAAVRRLVLFILVAVFAQIARNWLLLNAVGVHASIFDAIAVLIAMVTLSQLPVGPSVGAAAAVLILGRDGVSAVAAAGVLTTVTGTIGGLAFAAWAGADRLWAAARARRPAQRLLGAPQLREGTPEGSRSSAASTPLRSNSGSSREPLRKAS